MVDKPKQPLADSGDEFLRLLAVVSQADVEGLKAAQKSYGNSWKSRGGVGAFMMLARKWDRMENRLKKVITFGIVGSTSQPVAPPVGAYDIFGHVIADTRAEGVIDDIRDLRRYLMLVEAELLARGYDLSPSRDNVEAQRHSHALLPDDWDLPPGNGIHGTDNSEGVSPRSRTSTNP